MSSRGKETGAQVVSDLFGTALEWAVQAGSARKQYKYNSRLMKQQNQMNIDMWNMNNEYNSPAAQMQRYQDAGLNPNLLYGNGQTSSGNSTSSPEQKVATYQAPQYRVRGLTNVAATMLQERSLKNQEKLTDAEVNLKRQQTISESMSHTSRLLDNLNKQLDAARKTGDLKLFRDTYEDKKRAIGLQNENLLAQRDLTLATKDKIDTENQIGIYNLNVQLPLQSENIRRQLRKLDNENIYQRLMNLDMNEKVKYSARKYGLEVDTAEQLLNRAKEEVSKLKRENDLSAAEAVLLYLKALPDYDPFGKANAKRALKGLLETYFDINLGF